MDERELTHALWSALFIFPYTLYAEALNRKDICPKYSILSDNKVNMIILCTNPKIVINWFIDLNGT